MGCWASAALVEPEALQCLARSSGVGDVDMNKYEVSIEFLPSISDLQKQHSKLLELTLSGQGLFDGTRLVAEEKYSHHMGFARWESSDGKRQMGKQTQYRIGLYNPLCKPCLLGATRRSEACKGALIESVRMKEVETKKLYTFDIGKLESGMPAAKVVTADNKEVLFTALAWGRSAESPHHGVFVLPGDIHDVGKLSDRALRNCVARVGIGDQEQQGGKYPVKVLALEGARDLELAVFLSQYILLHELNPGWEALPVDFSCARFATQRRQCPVQSCCMLVGV